MVHENSLPTGDRDEDDWDEDLTPKITVKTIGTCTYGMEPEVVEAGCPSRKYGPRLETVSIISQEAIWRVSEDNGWHDPACDLTTDLLLIHSEISEATEALRAGKLLMSDGDDSVEEELADAVIRILHTASKNGMNVIAAVEKKHRKNMKRPYRHGGKKF